jgi:hypothetical protein
VRKNNAAAVIKTLLLEYMTFNHTILSISNCQTKMPAQFL